MSFGCPYDDDADQSDEVRTAARGMVETLADAAADA
jgi:hypothetical protein